MKKKIYLASFISVLLVALFGASYARAQLITFAGNISGAGAPNFMDGIGKVRVSGNYAYVVAVWDNAFNVIAVSNPSSPTLAASVRGFQSPYFISAPTAIDVVGNLAYVLSVKPNVGQAGITIFDISNPTNPTVVGHLFSDYFGNANTIRVDSGYAYVVQGPNSWISVVDVSNPATPNLVSVFTLHPTPHATFPFDIDISGNYAFVPAASNDTLYVIDISNPFSLQVGATISGPGAPNFLDGPLGVRILGNHAFVTAGFDNSLTVIDISNPLAPTFVSNVAGAGAPNFLGGARHLHISGNHAFVVAGSDIALTAVDISNPLAPAVSGSVQGAGAPNFLHLPIDVFVFGRHAYVAAAGNSARSIGDNSLSIFDITGLLPSCVTNALALAGIPVSNLPQDTLNDLIVACSTNNLVEIAPNSGVNSSVPLGPGEVLIVAGGASVDGNISGDGTNTVVLGSDVQITGNIRNIEQLFIGGSNVFIDGNYRTNVKELIIGPGADANLLTGNVEVDKLAIEEAGALHIGGNLMVRQTLTLEPNTVLQVDGRLVCNLGTTVTKDPTATVIVLGKQQCSGV